MPRPAITDDTRPFWDGCRRHVLLVQRCTRCAAFRHPPSPVCWQCRSFDHEWVASSGRGTLFSYAVVHRAFLPSLAGCVPYTVAVVALDDAPGVRLVSNVIEAAPETLAMGLPLEVVFEDVSADVTVPRFRVRRT
ncbi:MAG TPA: OB-fold domain-containing protein [Candidatus Binatia bacterium]|nr:OB-fold domain-containing protein [Candidatus Binatia bacterium]